MSKYRCLKEQTIEIDEFKIIPIRFEDRYEIMKWRNDQIYHLRQSKILTFQDQDLYFKNIISQNYDKEYPEQLLFSFLENNTLIGYGGMVHLNWIDKNAEISFLINTELEFKYFDKYLTCFLRLIEKVAFLDLNLHKLYTYAYDLRPHIYSIFESEKYYKEAILKEHVYYNKQFIDVVIHAKINLK
jgi:RimJ/RimL family protein N-acetyltransferase